MYKLAWALSGTMDNFDEMIQLYKKILEISTDTEMRSKVSRDLMYRYSGKRETDTALAYAKDLPTFDLCQEYHLGRSNIFEGRELSEYLQENIQEAITWLEKADNIFKQVQMNTSDEISRHTMTKTNLSGL